AASAPTSVRLPGPSPAAWWRWRSASASPAGPTSRRSGAWASTPSSSWPTARPPPAPSPPPDPIGTPLPQPATGSPGARRGAATPPGSALLPDYPRRGHALSPCPPVARPARVGRRAGPVAAALGPTRDRRSGRVILLLALH